MWFSKPGSFTRFAELIGACDKSSPWDEDTQRLFKSNYLHFEKEYIAKGGQKLSITIADAMLSYITIYGYDTLLETPTHILGRNLTKIWDEFLMVSEENSIALILQPNTKHQLSLLSKLKTAASGHLKIAFIHAKTAETSAWTYSHELGRTHLFSSAYLTIAPAIFLPSSVFRRFVYVHLPCVCAEPCSLWNLRIRPSARYIRSFSLG